MEEIRREPEAEVKWEQKRRDFSRGAVCVAWEVEESRNPDYRLLNQKADKTNHSNNRMWKAKHQRDTCLYI